MRMVFVFHAAKSEVPTDAPTEIRANPPATIKGMREVQELVEKLRKFAPFAALYASRLARATDTASILALAFDLDFSSLKELGQHASRSGNESVYYPGCEDETYATWRDGALKAIEQIRERHYDKGTVLVVSHRPIIASLMMASLGISNPDVIRKLARSADFPTKPFVVIDFDGQNITIVDQ